MDLKIRIVAMSSTENGTIRIHFTMSFKSFERNVNSMKKELDHILSESEDQFFLSGQSSSDWQLIDKSEIQDEKLSRRRIVNMITLNSEKREEKQNCLMLSDPNDHNSPITIAPMCQFVNSEIESIYAYYDCAFKVKV